MVKSFCTLFDSYYIHKGIALYLSLARTTTDFKLYVMAFDRASYQLLLSCGFDNMIVEYEEESDFYTAEIQRVKAERKRNEYCWTCGANITMYFMNKYHTADMTYLDADMMFFSNVDDVWSEVSSHSVSLSPHFADTELYGNYCVQFCYFKNNIQGRNALEWWSKCCIDWCYDRYEDGKFGDQRYLDIMPQKFEDVYSIENRGVGVAKWNMLSYAFLPNHKIQFENIIFNVIFFHFHAVAVEYKEGTIRIASKKDVIPQSVIDEMFLPYGELLKEVYTSYLKLPVNNVIVVNPGFARQILQNLKNVFRRNKLVQWLYFKFIKGHTGYNKKQI